MELRVVRKYQTQREYQLQKIQLLMAVNLKTIRLTVQVMKNHKMIMNKIKVNKIQVNKIQVNKIQVNKMQMEHLNKEQQRALIILTQMKLKQMDNKES
jgi:hypothetical protein